MRAGLLRLLGQARKLSVLPMAQIRKRRKAPRRRKKRIAATPQPANRLIDEQIGTYNVRLAETWDEIDAALALRYRVFYEEMKARPTPGLMAKLRDVDEFDPYCDHLLVLDTSLGQGPEAVVGTYRMLRRAGAARVGRFYSSAEFDIQPIIDYPGEILEMGRSCIQAQHRTRAAMQIMWRGVTAYVLAHKIDILFGCASLHGTDPNALALPLSYLYHHHLAPAELRPVALPQRCVAMNMLARDAVDAKAAMRDLPPMIKGYLRLGGMVGDGAVIDHEFNTVDIMVFVDMARVTGRYLRHYTRSLQHEA